MQYRILDLGNQYKVASLFGMRYSIQFDRYTEQVAVFETRLTQRMGVPMGTGTARRARVARFHESYKWYSGWKNLHSASLEWVITFRSDQERTIALLMLT